MKKKRKPLFPFCRFHIFFCGHSMMSKAIYLSLTFIRYPSLQIGPWGIPEYLESISWNENLILLCLFSKQLFSSSLHCASSNHHLTQILMSLKINICSYQDEEVYYFIIITSQKVFALLPSRMLLWFALANLLDPPWRQPLGTCFLLPPFVIFSSASH